MRQFKIGVKQKCIFIFHVYQFQCSLNPSFIQLLILLSNEWKCLALWRFTPSVWILAACPFLHFSVYRALSENQLGWPALLLVGVVTNLSAFLRFWMILILNSKHCMNLLLHHTLYNIHVLAYIRFITWSMILWYPSFNYTIEQCLYWVHLINPDHKFILCFNVLLLFLPEYFAPVRPSHQQNY
jgi:hypothetical protein